MTQKEVTPERKAFLDRMQKQIENAIKESLKYIEGFEEEIKEPPIDSHRGNIVDRTKTTRRVTEALLNNSKVLLEQYENALHRIKTNNGEKFGICCRCEEEISLPRIEKTPYALFCIDCATLVERNCK